MSYFVNILRAVPTILTVILVGVSLGYGQIVPGQKAPVFELADIHGKRYNLASMESHPMIILYFFDVASRPSQEGLLALDDLAKRYADADLKVWAITLSAKDRVMEFVSKSRIDYPFLLDTSKVSDLYQARFVLPTICILGPRLQILDYIQGGGKATEIMLVKLAEKELQRKQPAIAKAITENVIRQNPQNAEAEMVKGYAELKGGDLAAAEKTFQNLSRKKGQGEVLGKEGMVSVYAQKGQAKKALKLAEEVEKKAPDRSHVNAVKADILYAEGKINQAQTEYQKAVNKKSATPFQKATALNKLGRLQASVGNLSQARELYDQAVALDPYNIEATANSGQTYEKEGKWDKALDAYRQALAVNKDDVFAAALAKRAQSMLSLQDDVDKRKRMDRIVNRLAERYRSQQKSAPKEEDTWTSQPLAISFLDIQEKGGLPEREGFASVLIIQLSDQLNSSGRIHVVERILIEKLLEELNLGSSDLSDPDTALRLGKLLAAKIIGLSSLYYFPGGTFVGLRLIDTETAAIQKVLLRQINYGASIVKILNNLNRDILKTIVLKYPLKGYVAQAETEQIMINIGWKQGVIRGTQFEIFRGQEPIDYEGKILRTSPIIIAQVEVNHVGPDFSYAHILDQRGPIQRDDKVKEKIADLSGE